MIEKILDGGAGMRRISVYEQNDFFFAQGRLHCRFCFLLSKSTAAFYGRRIPC